MRRGTMLGSNPIVGALLFMAVVCGVTFAAIELKGRDIHATFAAATEPVTIASADEWVTYPSGGKVCRLNQDVAEAQRSAFGTSFYWRTVCSDWHEAEPSPATPIPAWIRHVGDFWSIHIGDTWR